MEFEELSGRIIDAAIKVHKVLGPGFVESIYENALCIQLEKEKMGFEVQKEVRVYYENKEVGLHRLDLIVGGEIIVELKAAKGIEDIHLVQVRYYLKATGLKIGPVLNFAKPTLEIKGVVN